MDRFTVAGVLIDVKSYYHGLGNSEAGSIQTAFICTYMIFSPIFGYMGDRYTRKYIMAVGIFLWSAFTLASSFVPADYFWAFVLLRALVGIGEASYSTIAPTIIADLFSSDMRTTALMVFYFAIPVGSGLGYIVGSKVAELLSSWQWALRVTPGLGVICVILIIFYCEEPKRGMSEGSDVHLSNTSLTTDLKTLIYNKSFMLSSVGFTCVAFVTGALAFLAPTFMYYATQIQGQEISDSTVSLIFGGITVAAGFIGVACGAEIARRYKRINPRADPLICAIGMITCAPFLFFSLVLSRYSIGVTWLLIFVGEVLLCLNWAVTADILLYVVIPTRRSLAESVQILLSHALGDAISPYIIGQIADAMANKHPDPTRPFVQFPAMQTALYLTTFVCVIGGGCYLATAIYVERDKREAEEITHGQTDVLDNYGNGTLDDGAYVNNVADQHIHSA
uniref:Major facilitator superfamily (MFS) profile domain-containing protein n=1 Tax=Arion vulgaris TaxID=1028688 RepID=A0A0B7AKL1_9EUPU